MNHEIDSITHRITTMQIAKEILGLFTTDKCKTVHVVMLASEAKLFPARLRVSVTRLWNDSGVKAYERQGVRCSDPFPYSFGDNREGVFVCVVVTPYASRTKSVAKAMLKLNLKEMVL